MTRDDIQAFRDWLPYPVYLFVGGPFDGQSLEVKLCEIPQGMAAPRLWRVHELPDFAGRYFSEQALIKASVTVHAYRFVPQRGSINEGHYEWIAPRESQP